MFLYMLMSTLMLGQLTFCIHGGTDADVGLFQAFGYISQQGRNEPMCGATLITNHHIITIAPCLQNWNKRQLYVQFGVTDWCKEDSMPSFIQWSYFTDVFIENYADPEGALAIASLVIIIRNIAPMNPPPNGGPNADATFGICGFGVFDTQSYHKSCTLRQAELVLRRHHHACSQQSGLICADPKSDSPQSGSMCYNDEGGPLVECINNGPNLWCYLTGIQWKTSDGSCTGTNLARRIRDSVEWINNIIKQS